MRSSLVRDGLVALELLASEGRLTLRRFLELAMPMVADADENPELATKLAAYGARLSPDVEQLETVVAQLARPAEAGALTAARLNVLREQARMAVGDRTDLLEPYPDLRDDRGG